MSNQGRGRAECYPYLGYVNFSAIRLCSSAGDEPQVLRRFHHEQEKTLGLGVMTYNHQTRQIEASDYGYFKTIPQLAQHIEKKLLRI